MTDCLFFDINIGGVPVGRIIFKLYSDIAPRTCYNFKCLCTGEKGIGTTTQKPLHFKSTFFHRVIRNFMIQGEYIQYA